MQKEVQYGLGGLVIGVLLAVLVASGAVNNDNQGMMRMMGMNIDSMMEDSEDHGMMGMGSSMDDMMDSLENKSGDSFDEAFIEAMIVHHEGAIDMAEEAKKNAKHQEIKDLADDIIEAQTKEINQMKEWQKAWDYE
jgi:uncharacterized protein (DUF305 family)